MKPNHRTGLAELTQVTLNSLGSMDWSQGTQQTRWAYQEPLKLSQESEPVINIRAFTLDFLTVFFFPDRGGGAPEDESFVYKLISATCQKKPWGDDFPIFTGVKRKLKCKIGGAEDCFGLALTQFAFTLRMMK